MRYSLLALLLAFIPSTASAQGGVLPVAQRLPLASQISPEIVVARVMSFDRNQDGKVSAEELSERMRTIVARGDTGGDGALDAGEIRAVAAPGARKVGSVGNYNFGDLTGLPIRTRIANALKDLCLPAGVSEEAFRIGETYAGEVEDAALAKLRDVVAPMLTEAQLAEFEASVKSPGASGVMIKMLTQNGAVQEATIATAFSMLQLRRYKLSAEQQKAAMAAMSAFNADRQLDDARRSVLTTRFEGVLSDVERDDLQAALTRRPLVKNAPGKNSGFILQSDGTASLH